MTTKYDTRTDRPACAVDACTRASRTKGLCHSHYEGNRRGRAFLFLNVVDERTPAERFWSQVTKTDTCWLWTGRTTDDDYGVLWWDGRGMVGAHRVSIALTTGAMPPAGMEPDHLCRVRNCVRPEHLEVVPKRENVLRSDCPPALNARKTTCPQNHPYDTVDSQGRRRCLTCQRKQGREAQRRHRARKRALEVSPAGRAAG